MGLYWCLPRGVLLTHSAVHCSLSTLSLAERRSGSANRNPRSAGMRDWHSGVIGGGSLHIYRGNQTGLTGSREQAEILLQGLSFCKRANPDWTQIIMRLRPDWDVCFRARIGGEIGMDWMSTNYYTL